MNRWKEAEIFKLKEVYYSTPMNELVNVFGRTKAAIQRKASQIGINKINAWTNEEKALLRSHYPTTSRKKLVKILNRSIRAIEFQAQEMGLKKSNLYWSRADKELLIKLYPTTSNDALAKLLNRSRHAVILMATQTLKINKDPDFLNLWSKLELFKLKKLYCSTPSNKLAKLLNRKTYLINAKAVALGLKKDNDIKNLRTYKDNGYKGWSLEEKKLFRELYPTTIYSKLMKIFNCSSNAIENQADILGIKKTNLYWTKTDHEELIQLYPKTSNLELARRFNRTPIAIYARAARKLNLVKDPEFVKQQRGYPKVIRETSFLISKIYNIINKHKEINHE